MSQNFKILIIDDDVSFSDSLSQNLKAYNYEVLTCSSIFEAEDELKNYCPDLLIVDLFMPSGNGSEWVTSLLAKVDFQTPVVYASGVFTDLDFQNSLLTNPLILKVLSKPFAMSALVKVIEKWESTKKIIDEDQEKVSELEPIEQALVGRSYLDSSFWDNLKQSSSFSANNLPQYLNYFFHSNATGVLQLVRMSEKIEIHYSQGNIVFIQMNDSPTSFGVLLAKLTRLNYSEIEKHCIAAKSANQNIGQFLFSNNLISDLEIFKVINLQIALRLLQLFNEDQVTCRWKEKEVSADNRVGYFTKTEWKRVLIRFSASLSNQWLEKFFNTFSPYYLILREKNLPEEVKDEVLKNNFFKIQESLASSHLRYLEFNLIEGLQKERSIYLFLLLDVLALSRFKQLSKEDLINIADKNKNKNYFELLNVSVDSTEINIKKKYRQLVKKFHPDNYGSVASPEEKALYQEIFNSISEAYATLSKSEMRESYESLLGQEQFEEQFKGQLLEGEIISQLEEKNLEGIVKKINHSSIIYGKKQVFLLWALYIAYTNEDVAIKRQSIKLKMATYMQNIPESIKQFNHFIYLAKALYCQVIGNFLEAKYYFNKIQDTGEEGINIQGYLDNIEGHLLREKNKTIKKRDKKLGIIFSALVLGVLGYKVTVSKSTISPSLVSEVASSPSVLVVKKQKEVKRGLSSVERKMKVEQSFSYVSAFHVVFTEEREKYKLVHLQNYSFSSDQTNKKKLKIFIYKQLGSKGTVTEKNFLQKQRSLADIYRVLNFRVSLKKQTSTVWYGKLLDKARTTVTVQYIKKYKSFIYFVGNFDSIPTVSQNVVKGLSKL